MRLIRYLWQLPQHLLALAILFTLRKRQWIKIKERDHIHVYKIDDIDWGVSLGGYILVSDHASNTTINHEIGHSIQSALLGPLYLLVVGLPSVVMNAYSAAAYLYGYDRPAIEYYDRWPESWADRLGGVKR